MFAPGRHAETADQSGDQVREDVAEQIGGDQHVELPGIQHELHGARIDDDGVQDETALVLALVELESGLEKDPGERLHDVRLVDDRDLLAAGGDRVLERELQEPAAPLAGVNAGGHGDGVRVVVDLDVMLVPDVQALEIFAHHDEIDVVEAAARNQGSRWPEIGVQLEFLAQAHIGRSITAPGRGLERALQGEPRAADARDGLGGEGILGDLHALESSGLPFPLKGRSERIQSCEDRLDDLGTDAVSGNEGGGNGLCHLKSLLMGTNSMLSPAPRSYRTISLPT